MFRNILLLGKLKILTINLRTLTDITKLDASLNKSDAPRENVRKYYIYVILINTYYNVLHLCNYNIYLGTKVLH